MSACAHIEAHTKSALLQNVYSARSVSERIKDNATDVAEADESALSPVDSLGCGTRHVRRRRPRTLPRIPPAQEKSCWRKGGHWTHSIAAEFLLGIRGGREPMRLASRTRPKLGRTINSCVFFPTNRPLSRFVSRPGRQNWDIFSRMRVRKWPACSRACRRLEPPNHPGPNRCRLMPLLAGKVSVGIGKVCAKSRTRIIRYRSLSACPLRQLRPRTAYPDDEEFSCHAICGLYSVCSPACCWR